MKLCCSSQSLDHLFQSGDMDLFGFVDYAADTLGIDCVELEDKHFLSTDEAYLEKLCAYLADKRLSLVNLAFDCSFGYPLWEQNEAEVQRAQAWMEVACRLGCPNFRVFAGWMGGLDPEIGKKGPPVPKPEAAWETMIACVDHCCALAGERGLQIVIENHNHGGFLSHSKDVLRLFEEVRRDNLSLLLDTGNYVDGIEGMIKTMHLVQKHVHIKVNDIAEDGQDRVYDLPAILNVIKDSGYRETLSIEYEGNQDERIYIQKVMDYIRHNLATGQ